MARDIWVTSDWHYGHEGILKFVDYQGQRVREFDTVDQMNECLLDSHNSVVKPQDIVWNLGDVFFGSKEKFIEARPKFNGAIRLIFGNHDDCDYIVKMKFFQKTSFWRIFAEHNLVLTHTAQHVGGLFRGKDLAKPMLNVHGHIHRLDSPPGPYFNVCVEKTNYTPVHIEDLAAIATKYRETQWEADYANLFSTSLRSI